MKRILWALGWAVLALGAIYMADNISLRFHIPAGRKAYGAVQVQTLYAVKQKNGRLEYTLGDTEEETCVNSVFPQMGLPPCWYLAGHATRQILIGWARPGLPGQAPYCPPRPLPALGCALGLGLRGIISERAAVL